jgi:diaminopimelate epimerase
MKIPFTKAHGAQNDFLLTWAEQVPDDQLPAIAKAICHRHTGVGADGWLVVYPGGISQDLANYDCAIRLFNPDGSEPEISGNGTRCAAAFALHAGLDKPAVKVMTGAGLKSMRVLERSGLSYLFEMNMGRVTFEDGDLQRTLETTQGPKQAAVLNVGNPQCSVLVDDFDFDWVRLGAELEKHPHFPNKTNVSFVRVVDRNTLEVRIFERGVGATMSSGTGCTGAAAGAMLRGLVDSPVHVLTPAGPLDVRRDGEDYLLTGPVEITVTGEFHWSESA